MHVLSSEDLFLHSLKEREIKKSMKICYYLMVSERLLDNIFQILYLETLLHILT